ncbi:orotidine-5'-phosphate decarboxylase [Ferrovibrio terrae]|uniref:Orotidine 5'-phosphate decarboxylase n=1 Tax=Ferrovibrio terrae TaxID=2594003 RepID=A0A516H273_9PROT|nr:orotidine-5'-phosphate decarboxylase [Ferrovibrio terrae]QDO97845.1 orotidine-5'-phosphate decarboxylase [Ferrovibrio terrae]
MSKTSLSARIAPVFCAIDTIELAFAARCARAAAAAGFGVKLGKEFFTAHGPAEVRAILPVGTPLFLDLKFHDIPNTVAGAVRSAAAAMGPMMLTVHATGGPAMIRQAVDAAHQARQRPLILAVTALTSLDASDLQAIGVNEDVSSYVVRLAKMAQANGADGVICAATEIDMLRKACGPDFKLVVPGIRPKGSAAGDQKRVMTPGDALKLGADHLVIGRPITEAASPEASAQAIAQELAESVLGAA